MRKMAKRVICFSDKNSRMKRFEISVDGLDDKSVAPGLKFSSSIPGQSSNFRLFFHWQCISTVAFPPVSAMDNVSQNVRQKHVEAFLQLKGASLLKWRKMELHSFLRCLAPQPEVEREVVARLERW